MDPALVLTRYAPKTFAASDQELRGFRFRDEPIPYEAYRRAVYAIAEMHLSRRRHGRGGGLLLTGPSGAGKSTILHSYLGMFPRIEEADGTRISVLLVSVPSSPTSRSLASAILEALDKRQAHLRTAAEKTTRTYELFARCGVEILLLDEFQHLSCTPTTTAFRDVTDWLKNFLSVTGVAVVACGLPESEAVVNSNEQLARRFSARIRLTPFSLEDDDFRTFRGVLNVLEERLPLPCATPLREANLARRLHVASYGLIDYVIKILEGAVSVSVREGQRGIDLPILQAAFRDRIWRDVPSDLNPFSPQSLLRPLDKPGEVFHLHATRKIASPVGRRAIQRRLEDQ